MGGKIKWYISPMGNLAITYVLLYCELETVFLEIYPETLQEK